MTKCTLHSFMIPAGPFGEGRAVTRCDTHDWQFDGKPAMQCPIGRIEEAASMAIANLKREAAGMAASTDIRELGLMVQMTGIVGDVISGSMIAGEKPDGLR